MYSANETYRYDKNYCALFNQIFYWCRTIKITINNISLPLFLTTRPSRMPCDLNVFWFYSLLRRWRTFYRQRQLSGIHGGSKYDCRKQESCRTLIKSRNLSRSSVVKKKKSVDEKLRYRKIQFRSKSLSFTKPSIFS